MRSRLFPILAVPVVLTALSGCAFTQWTDNAFLGSAQDPPRHANREWAAAVLLPLAITGDVITAPIQVVILLVTGDYGIYAYRTYPAYDDRVSTGSAADDRLANIDPADADRLVRAAQLRLASGREAVSPRAALGLDAYGNIVEVALTADQHATLLARAASGGRPVRLALN